MQEWTTVASELRSAKQAREEFIMRAFIEQSIIGPLLLDRLAYDLDMFADRQMTTSMSSLQPIQPNSDEG